MASDFPSVPPRLILASASPRRRMLLAELGIPFDVVTSCFDESQVDHADPVAFAREAARGKCLDVAATREGDTVTLGSDTVVTFPEETGKKWRILGKPGCETEACQMLEMLSGREHRVVTAVAVARGKDPARVDSDVSRVRFRPLEADEIRAYVATGEPMDKAGAYGVQGLAGTLIESVEGDLNTVIGLPLALVSRMLREFYPNLAEAAPVAFGGAGHGKREG